MPFTLHVTDEFRAFCTVTLNCCVFPTRTFGDTGLTVTATAGMIVVVAPADFVVSAAAVAVTVTRAGFGTAAGAV